MVGHVCSHNWVGQHVAGGVIRPVAPVLANILISGNDQGQWVQKHETPTRVSASFQFLRHTPGSCVAGLGTLFVACCTRWDFETSVGHTQISASRFGASFLLLVRVRVRSSHDLRRADAGLHSWKRGIAFPQRAIHGE